MQTLSCKIVFYFDFTAKKKKNLHSHKKKHFQQGIKCCVSKLSKIRYRTKYSFKIKQASVILVGANWFSIHLLSFNLAFLFQYSFLSKSIKSLLRRFSIQQNVSLKFLSYSIFSNFNLHVTLIICRVQCVQCLQTICFFFFISTFLPGKDSFVCQIDIWWMIVKCEINLLSFVVTIMNFSISIYVCIDKSIIYESQQNLWKNENFCTFVSNEISFLAIEEHTAYYLHMFRYDKLLDY